MKTLLVLAASTYQVDTIKTAKKLGFRVLTADNRPNNPGHELADQSYNVDTTDCTAIMQIASSQNVSGVIAPCTDVAVPTAAYVSEKLGLPGVPLQAARILTNKVTFRKFLQDKKIPSPKYYSISKRNHELPEISWENGPWIIKPDFSSGSKGIFVVRDLKELIERLPQSFCFSPNGTVLIEQFIEGHQGTCEGVLENGRIRLGVILDRQTAEPPYVVTTGHHLPTELGCSEQARIIERLEIILSCLGVKEGPFDCDFIISNGEIFILEMTPRLGGNSISQLVRITTGFDFVEYAVNHALGQKNILPNEWAIRPGAVIILGAEDAGILLYNENETIALKNETWVHSIKFEAAIGKRVEKFINGRHRIGEAFIFASNRNELNNRVFELKARLGIATCN